MIDLRLMIFRLLKPKLRKEKLMELLYMLMYALEYIQGIYTAFRTATIYRMTWPNQKLSIEQLLRDELANPAVTIGWLDSSPTDFIVSPTSYQQDLPLLPITGDGPIMREDGDIETTYGACFIVNAPGESASEVLIKEIIDRYNHAGILYEINYA